MTTQISKKAKRLEYLKAQHCEKSLKITVPKNTQRNAHKTQKPLFPQLQTLLYSKFF